MCYIYSAGTETLDRINPDAVRLMKKHYGIDMEETQRPKLLNEIPPTDYVIMMGCNVECPLLPCKYQENWGIDDPAGKSDKDFLKIISRIEGKVLELKRELSQDISYRFHRSARGAQAGVDTRRGL